METSVKNAEKVTLETLREQVAKLTERVAVLEEFVEQKNSRNKSEREMTDEDARRILNGDLKDASHKKCMETLKLSYGQVYSCRLHYTFKHIHRELEKISGYKNKWVK